MKRIVCLISAVALVLCVSATAEAGPLCGLLRGAGRIASAPLRAAGRVRANRYEARQARYEARAGACAK